jgi:MFS family permease
VVKEFGFIKTFNYIDYLCIFAAFVGALNLSISTQILSRLLLGIIVGINTIIIPVYLTSCLPGSMGGPAGTLNQLFITIGIFFGYWFSYLTIDSGYHDLGWRIIIGFPILPCLVRLHTTRNVFP